MAHIKSRKHSITRHSHCSAAVVMAAMTFPVMAQQAADTTLPEVKVTGQMESYKPEVVSSPKYSQPLVDTPQTISVIKKEVMQEQGVTTLTEALRNTPGITLQLGENANTATGDAISMRGFDTQNSIFVDGIRDLGSYSRDMFNIEQVEVLKGPTGADVGRASAGGYINLQSKAPRAQNSFDATAAYGTADRYRVTADVNRRIDEEGTSAVRLNLMKQGGGVAGRDYVENESYGIAPSVIFGLNTPTQTTLSFLHSKQNNRPDGGVPTVGLPGYQVVAGGTVTAAQAAAGNAAPAVDPSNYYGSINDFNKIEVNMFTAKVEHAFTDKLKLRNTFRFGKVEQFNMTTGMGGATFVTPGDLSSYTVGRNRADGMNRYADGGQGKVQTNELITNQTHLSSEFETGGLKHTLGAGVELIYERQKKNHLMGASGGTGTNGGTITAANLYNPNPYFALLDYNPRENGAYDHGVTKTIGAYVFDTIELNDKWQISGGVRVDRFSTDFETFRLAGTTSAGGGGTGTPLPADTRTNLSASDTLVSYKIGALYKPTVDSSVYGLYSVSKRPPGGDNFSLSATANNANNPIAKPQEATNIEFGAKWDVNKSLALTGAIFNTTNENEIATDANNVTTQIGERRVRGIELGAVGQITSAWQVITGLTFLDSEITRGNAASGGNNATGGDIPFTPKRAFTSWTTYRLPSGLILGGGARYVSKITRSSAAVVAPATGLTESASYWVADAMASYPITKNATIQLNIYNLFDKNYVASFNNGGNRYTPGAPRSFLLTGNFKF
ncbi:catecholate siderophore receptor Fiu [uncultured Oxalicibacterium sp.]|uniref:catecholate siderophore receptor Fiu n=1 Tax=uncultured Oxalicibacterium sp. TaxID=1168540 RepID=UPI0025F28624|nr:catecholate siderophore receptor Fiu [uncultured Oxalicibacterium sp.]